ncbi:ribosomal protein S5 domain 2-type protein [Pseudomassariella vexata]|uniref:Ribosomal protein S5 domain 2-type protein n=1 Tax=Pseudomassariella vexata TaxID=1141098 RepID=A0A1Y2EIQ2_9PEZI|nr:ribosomal protein S5 domain 2-type protein [Pseudomassariella vexata]ORY71184.1 ribosomal protein S5 domain 2-type protein [Pseudomassariella vexata]
MSEELKDEVEAINSIYGDGCLVQSSDDTNVYILTPPGESASLRIQFPPAYPAEPPMVIGTNSTGEHGKKGDAVRELSILREAVGTVFEPGMVCVFDAIEELTRRLEESMDFDQVEEDEVTLNEPQEDSQANPNVVDFSNMPEPPWIISDPVIELKSTFIARCAAVSSTSEAEAFVQHLLSTDKKVRVATHNITAWRIKGPNNTSFQDCNDDGETAAGGRLLHLMQLMDVWDAMVIVTRWYGGHKLGPRRFALINQAARDAFIKAGLVEENSANKKKSKN